MSSTQDVTGLLVQWCQGNKEALDRLVPVVYEELRRLARARLRSEREGHSLQTSDLVHEAFLRLVGIDRMTLENRSHFFAVASRLMRQILVDHARHRDAEKRGGGATMVSLGDASPSTSPTDIDILELDEALDALMALDPRLCRVVELKYFGGLTRKRLWRWTCPRPQSNATGRPRRRGCTIACQCPAPSRKKTRPPA